MNYLNNYVMPKLKTLKSGWGLFALFFALFGYMAQAKNYHELESTGYSTDITVDENGTVTDMNTMANPCDDADMYYIETISAQSGSNAASTGTTGYDGGYSDFTSEVFVVDLTESTSIDFTLTADGAHPDVTYMYELWVDRDQDGNFAGPNTEGDNEFIYADTSVGGDLSGTLDLQAIADILGYDNVQNEHPCDTYVVRVIMSIPDSNCDYGEVNDFSIKIISDQCEDEDDTPPTGGQDCDNSEPVDAFYISLAEGTSGSGGSVNLPSGYNDNGFVDYDDVSDRLVVHLTDEDNAWFNFTIMSDGNHPGYYYRYDVTIDRDGTGFDSGSVYTTSFDGDSNGNIIDEHVNLVLLAQEWGYDYINQHPCGVFPIQVVQVIVGEDCENYGETEIYYVEFTSDECADDGTPPTGGQDCEDIDEYYIKTISAQSGSNAASTGTTGYDGGYSDFTSEVFVVDLTESTSIDFTLTADGAHPDVTYMYELWVDRDQDGNFAGPNTEGDNEFIYADTSVGGDLSGTLDLQAIADILGYDNVQNEHPCDTYVVRVIMSIPDSNCDYGEVNDFSIKIISDQCEDEDDTPPTGGQDCDNSEPVDAFYISLAEGTSGSGGSVSLPSGYNDNGFVDYDDVSDRLVVHLTDEDNAWFNFTIMSDGNHPGYYYRYDVTIDRDGTGFDSGSVYTTSFDGDSNGNIIDEHVNLVLLAQEWGYDYINQHPCGVFPIQVVQVIVGEDCENYGETEIYYVEFTSDECADDGTPPTGGQDCDNSEPVDAFFISKATGESSLGSSVVIESGYNGYVNHNANEQRLVIDITDGNSIWFDYHIESDGNHPGYTYRYDITIDRDGDGFETGSLYTTEIYGDDNGDISGHIELQDFAEALGYNDFTEHPCGVFPIRVVQVIEGEVCHEYGDTEIYYIEFTSEWCDEDDTPPTGGQDCDNSEPVDAFYISLAEGTSGSGGSVSLPSGYNDNGFVDYDDVSDRLVVHLTDEDSAWFNFTIMSDGNHPGYYYRYDVTIDRDGTGFDSGSVYTTSFDGDINGNIIDEHVDLVLLAQEWGYDYINQHPCGVFPIQVVQVIVGEDCENYGETEIYYVEFTSDECADDGFPPIDDQPCSPSSFYINKVSGGDGTTHQVNESGWDDGYGDYRDIHVVVDLTNFNVGDTEGPYFEFEIEADGGHPDLDYYYEAWVDRNQDGVYSNDELPEMVWAAVIQGGNTSGPVRLYLGDFPEYNGEGCLHPTRDYSMKIVQVVECSSEAGATPQTFIETEEYTLRITGECGGELSVEDAVFENFTFYPNPVETNINLNAATVIEHVQVFNLLGQKVIEVKPNTTQTQINAENLSSGMYIMKVTIEGAEKTFRVIKR